MLGFARTIAMENLLFLVRGHEARKIKVWEWKVWCAFFGALAQKKSLQIAL